MSRSYGDVERLNCVDVQANTIRSNLLLMLSLGNLQKILHDVPSSVSESLKVPVCITEVAPVLRSHFLRTNEVC